LSEDGFDCIEVGEETLVGELDPVPYSSGAMIKIASQLSHQSVRNRAVNQIERYRCGSKTDHGVRNSSQKRNVGVSDQRAKNSLHK
jgi:hypothetical protein